MTHLYSTMFPGRSSIEVYSTGIEFTEEAVVWRNPLVFINGTPIGFDFIPEYHAIKLKSGDIVSTQPVGYDVYAAGVKRYARWLPVE